MLAECLVAPAQTLNVQSHLPPERVSAEGKVILVTDEETETQDRFTSLLKACCSLVAQLCLTL